jgi:hypothetical protein
MALAADRPDPVSCGGQIWQALDPDEIRRWRAMS